MADADRDQLDRRAGLDLLDDVAQVPLEIVAGIDRQRGIVDRRTVGDHHQNLALLGPAEQALVRPVQRLAVDVLLQQTLAHHQAEVLARTAPGGIRRLVDDVAEIVEAAGIGRLAGGKPRLTRLSALPGARGEAEDLDLDATTLQRARQNVGAGRSHRDRAAAHRAGIVEQQRHHGVAERRLFLVHEGQRVIGVGHHARQPRRIQDALFEVEVPGAVLLRHQAPLKAVGEAGDDALQMRELLVEIGAQALQLVMVAEVFGRDDLIEFRREGMIFRPARLVLAVRVRTRRLAWRLVVAEFAVVERVGGRGLRAFHRALAHLLAGSLRLVGAHLLRGVGIGRAFGAGLVVVAVAVFLVVIVVFAVGAALVAELERGQQVMHGIAEPGLVLDQAIEPVEPLADLVLENGPPQIDHLLRRRGRRHAGQALAHQHRQRIRQRRIGTIGDFVELAAMEMVVEHRAEVFRNARHAARADRLDAGLLDRLEHAARLRIAGHQLAMQLCIVAGDLERDGVGVATHDRSVTLGHLSRGLRQAAPCPARARGARRRS